MGLLGPLECSPALLEITVSFFVSFQHTYLTAETLANAKHIVREQAIHLMERADADKDVVFVSADGDIYAYLDQARADADDTGTLAFAVIERVA